MSFHELTLALSWCPGYSPRMRLLSFPIFPVLLFPCRITGIVHRLHLLQQHVGESRFGLRNQTWLLGPLRSGPWNSFKCRIYLGSDPRCETGMGGEPIKGLSSNKLQLQLAQSDPSGEIWEPVETPRLGVHIQEAQGRGAHTVTCYVSLVSSAASAPLVGGPSGLW